MTSSQTPPARAVHPRAVLLTIDYTPQTGGQPLLVSSIINSTSDMIDWCVVTAAPGPETPQVVRTNGYLGLARAAWGLRDWLAAADDRLVVSGHVYLGPLAHAVGLATRSAVSTLCYGRELVPARMVQRLALATMRLDHRVVTISSNSERLVHGLGVDPSRTEWVGCELRPQFASATAPRPSGGAGLRLVTITRLAEGYKNLEVTLRAVAVLVADGTVDHYTIVGDGPRMEPLRERVAQLDLDDHVTLTGRLDNDALGLVLAGSDIGLFSSRNSQAEGGFEGFGIAVQELAAAGLPVIVGNAAGASDAVRPDWGTLVDPDNLLDWVDAISALAQDEPERRRRSQSAFDFGQCLDTSITARAYLDALRGGPTPTPIDRRKLMGIF
ncbi:MAG: glycosyltransferase [Actinomycetia bacterium]|nr:glycosyltransferase [Actinomycetes bacterium]